METQFQISLSDAPNNGRRVDDRKQPLVKKASRFRVFPAILAGAAFAAVAAWFFLSRIFFFVCHATDCLRRL
jgi:hypothetical protein